MHCKLFCKIKTFENVINALSKVVLRSRDYRISISNCNGVYGGILLFPVAL